MKRLIAARPIQYMGRTYARGDAVPAYDEKMVKAWLAAGSVAWTETAAAATAEAAAAATPATPEAQAAEALRGMGVSLTDDDGNFVGAENLTKQIHSAVSTSTQSGHDETRDNGNGQDGKEPTDGATTEKSGQEGTAKPEMVTGHLDAKNLEKTMTREQLNEMATVMELDISACHNKGDVAAMIAAEPVQAPEDENGGAQ